jgi:hypothetical protein
MSVNVIEFLLLVLIVFGKFILPPALIISFVMHAGWLWRKIRPMFRWLSLFVMAILPIILYAQDSPVDSYIPCAKATEHMTVPIHTTALTDYDVAPLEFLFSEKGADIYSATSYRRPYLLQWIRENGITVIIILQDETMRQKLIEGLRKQTRSFRAGFPQHLENVKYFTINFFGPDQGFVRDVEFFQPKPCVTHSEERLAEILWMHYSDFQVWAMPGLHASKNEPNWVTGDYSPYLGESARNNPLYVKMHNMMSAKINEYMGKHPKK